MAMRPLRNLGRKGYATVLSAGFEAPKNMGVSVKTAETHRANLMHKLKVHSVAEVVLYAIRHQIVQVETLSPAMSITAG